jgi:hypothetical protein
MHGDGTGPPSQVHSHAFVEPLPTVHHPFPMENVPSADGPSGEPQASEVNLSTDRGGDAAEERVTWRGALRSAAPGRRG